MPGEQLVAGPVDWSDPVLADSGEGMAEQGVTNETQTGRTAHQEGHIIIESGQLQMRERGDPGYDYSVVADIVQKGVAENSTCHVDVVFSIGSASSLAIVYNTQADSRLGFFLGIWFFGKLLDTGK